jgi:alanyl-tRNA synthetase
MLAQTQTDLAACEAAALAETAEPIEGARVLLRIIDGDANRLKMLATAIVSRPGLLVLLVSRSTPSLAVGARSADVAISCHELVARLAKEFGGRGGGKPELAQCGGLQAAPGAIIAWLDDVVRGRG